MFRTLILFGGLFLFASSVTKTDRFGLAFSKNLFAKSPERVSAPIYLIVSAIWQGDHIRAHNVTAIQEFRRKFGSIPLTHFLSPAYFLRSKKQAKQAESLIRSVLSINDEIGMILHPWRSVTAESSVLFRKGPSFWGNHLRASTCSLDCGGAVPLAVYPKNDVHKMMVTGVKTLGMYGFTNLKSFMAGGWMATPHVLSAAAANQFKYDYSAVSQHIIRNKLEHYPLYGWVGEVWKDVTPHTQPHKIPTDYGDIIEVGNSAAMVDYLSTQEIIDLFATYLAKKRANPSESLTFHIGFHQETAFKYLARLEAALQHIFAKTSEEQIQIKPLTIPIKSTTPDQQANATE